MSLIRNPILPGFHPDPSILRVGDDYYIATSTFEWFPGVEIHHSRDLRHWRLLTRALTRVSQLDMCGNRDSGGIWAPAISWHAGLYYLVYTDTKDFLTPFNDQHNYLVTATNIAGPWSEPVYLHSSGFDPSLFHDVDGRHWLVNMRWDHRARRNPFSGIVLQEYDVEKRRLIGPVDLIFSGTALGVTEGPHLFQRHGWYYLITAEGGTSYDHAVSIARARDLHGPYEVHPENPLLTSRGNPALTLQKAGHGSIVETQQGEWYLAHLASRPITEHRRCILGRETALQRCVWTADDWPRLAHGDCWPRDEIPAPVLPDHPFPAEPQRYDFDTDELPLVFQTLRAPHDPSWLSLQERPGWLRLRGRESPRSLHRQSLIARRLESFACRVRTRLDFEPVSFQQLAGLVAWYDTRKWYYLCVTQDEQAGRVLQLLECDDGAYGEPLDRGIPLPAGPCHLQLNWDHAELQFAWSPNGRDWLAAGPRLDASKLSDDYGTGYSFTGAFVGICVQDLAGTRQCADFDYFEYVVDGNAIGWQK